MRVGIVSPNILNDIDEHNAAVGDPSRPWSFESLAKRTSLLFDKLFLTEDLDQTCEIVGGGSGVCDDNVNCGTLRYLISKGLILTPQVLGYADGKAFLAKNLKGKAAVLHRQLCAVGNPSNNCEPGEYTYVGQPDIGDWEAHDGNHPRSERGWNDPAIEKKKIKYESLLVQRNVALLRQTGIEAVVVGPYPKIEQAMKHAHPVWNVVINEMPSLDIRAPWEDVFDFRAEERTKHLVRSVRRWIRKVITEEWTESDLEDEIRELLYEYDAHLRLAGIKGGRGVLKCVITGFADLSESAIKLRVTKIGELVTAFLDRKAKLLQAECEAPGHELALFPVMRNRFS